MKRTINSLFVPNIGTNDTVQGYTVIRFPTVEKDLEDLVNIKNAEIASRVDTRQDLLRHLQDKDKILVTVTNTRHAPSFDIALKWFETMTRKIY